MFPTRPLRHLVPLLIGLGCGPAARADEPPALHIAYDAAADQDCARRRHYEIRSDWVAELQAQLPTLQAMWTAQGPAMMRAAASLTGRPLPPQPITAQLMLCDEPSNSFTGIRVNMRYALRSFTPSPVPLRVKLDTVFHEWLHGFLSVQTPAASALLAERATESACVRNHLHLLALQKAVLLSLQQARELDQLIAVDEQLPSGCYRRAWALVNATPEGYRAYVDELAGQR